MYNGIINIYKEAGYTSHDVVAKLRGILGQKKIGHTGTLDPEAVGVLTVCLGKGTKVCELLTDKDKVYETVMRLGVVTDTQDMTGNILRESPVCVNRNEIEEVIQSFKGEYAQIPPMYSALKINGKKLYELAREGKTVERQPRIVHIFELDILDIDPEGAHVHMRVHCSKGTYIRTLCHDIGEKLGCGAAMETLMRVRVAGFEINQALTLAQVEKLVGEGNVEQVIWPIDSIFPMWPMGRTDAQADRLLYNGNMLLRENVRFEDGLEPEKGGKYRIYDSHGKFCAIYVYNDRSKTFKNEKMFV